MDGKMEDIRDLIAGHKAWIETLAAELSAIRAARGIASPVKVPKSASKAAPSPRDEGCPVEAF